MAAKLKMLSAAGAKSLADKLSGRLGAQRGAVVLLLTPELAADPHKDDLAREALQALAQQNLVLVQAGEAEAPLGLRDLPRLPWSPDGADEAAQIAAIGAGIETAAQAAAAAPAPARKKRGGLAIWLISGAIALVLLTIFVAGRFMFAAAPPPQGAAYEESPSPAGEMTDGATYQDQNTRFLRPLFNRVQELDQVMANENLRRIGAIENGGLQQTQSRDLPIILEADMSHRIAALCDTDCSAITLQLYDTSGVLLSEASGASPVVTLERQDNARNLNLRVTMTACAIAPCYYALAHYGDGAVTPPATATVPEIETPPLAATPDEFARVRISVEETEFGLSRLTWLVGGLGVLQLITLLALVWPRGEKRARKSTVHAASNASAAPTASGGLFFASYSRKDREQVDAVIDVIEREGLPIWLDRIDIGGGATWPEAIVQAIRGARGVIVFCSGNAFDSDNVLREINLAASYNKPLLPILIAPSNIPDSFLYYLSTQQMVDPSSDQQWREKVLQSLKGAA